MLTKHVVTRKGLTITALLAVMVLMAAMSLAGSRGETATAQAGPRLAAEWTFSGRVYEGDLGVEPPGSQPLEGVTVSVYGANNPYPDSGTFIRSTTTDAAG